MKRRRYENLPIIMGRPLSETNDTEDTPPPVPEPPSPDRELAEALGLPVELPEPTPSLDLPMSELEPPPPGGSGRIEPGTLVAEKYQVVRLLGAGGMGRVFVAEQKPLGRMVALKVLAAEDPSSSKRQRFLQEASICANLSHRNVVTVYDYGEHESGELFIAMELVRGRPLSLVLEEGLLEVERAMLFAKQVARALMAAHHQGIIHRDLKPSNIMVIQDEKGHDTRGIKVLDFGASKLLDAPNEEPPEIELTQAHSVVGSPLYMAPEQILRQPLSRATDIYALGALMFELLTSGRPFPGTDLSVLYQHVHGEVPKLETRRADLAEWSGLDALVRRCMAKNPEDRFATALEVIEAIEKLEERRGSPPP